MTLFNRNPLDCENVDELQQWVAVLQELLYAQKEINRSREQQNQILLQANQQQGVEIELLQEKVEQQQPVRPVCWSGLRNTKRCFRSRIIAAWCG